MHTELQRRLGVRDAPQDRADALVHGVIQSYDADVPVSFSANPQQAVTARRHLQVTVEVEIIDQSNGHVLLQSKALRGEADYAERAEDGGPQAGDCQDRADDRRRSAEQLVSAAAASARSYSSAACSPCSSSPLSCISASTSAEVYWRVYEFQDDMRQEVAFAAHRTNDAILHAPARPGRFARPSGRRAGDHDQAHADGDLHRGGLRRAHRAADVRARACTFIRTPRARCERARATRSTRS